MPCIYFLQLNKSKMIKLFQHQFIINPAKLFVTFLLIYPLPNRNLSTTETHFPTTKKHQISGSPWPTTLSSALLMGLLGRRVRHPGPHNHFESALQIRFWVSRVAHSKRIESLAYREVYIRNPFFSFRCPSLALKTETSN